MGEENGLSMATERRSRGEEHQSSTIHDPLSPHTQAHAVHTKTNAHTDYVHMYLNVNNFAFHIYTFLMIQTHGFTQMDRFYFCESQNLKDNSIKDGKL